MVRTRIAPSPTGEDLHIGNLYTAYLNWVIALKNKGQFIVRIEDTDRTRLVAGAEEKILQTLTRFGINPDESIITKGPYGPYRQSERLEIYTQYAHELIKKESAYYCTCSKARLDELRKKQIENKQVPKYDKHCLQTGETQPEGEYVIRLNVPENKEITFHDVIRGDITINTNDIDDQVLIKSDGFPTYHLAVVVDDHLMKISHVIRAEEWISSTPKHVLLYDALGWDKPIWAHVPILRNPDKSKLSKRKNPVWASWYLDQGFLPEAILNFLSLMGWSHPQGEEIFTQSEFIEVFSLERMQSAGPVFDIAKLEWMNGEYIRKMSISQLAEKLLEFFKGKYSEELIKKTVSLIQERIKTLKEFDEYCHFFIQKPEHFETDIAPYKALFESTHGALSSLNDWKSDQIGVVMQGVATKLGIKNGEYFMAMRIAITGKKVSPPLNESMEILRKEECLKRISLAI